MTTVIGFIAGLALGTAVAAAFGWCLGYASGKRERARREVGEWFT